MRLILLLVVLTAAAVFFVASFAAPARRVAASWGTLAPTSVNASWGT